MINVKYIETENEYNSALSIRKEVFIEEQNVSIEEEIDEYEKIATHILALENSKAVGTARWRYTDDGVKLERFAVLEPYRSHGVGRALVVICCRRIEGRKFAIFERTEICNSILS